jgi:hypothetical protein
MSAERANALRGPQVHALMAAGLADPALIREWLADPDVARQSLATRGAATAGLKPAELEDFLELLRRFAGLVAKVRQNQLRASLPLTFRALDVTGLENDLFADYAPRFASAARAVTLDLEARKVAFVDFAREWLEISNPDHALVLDVMNHELLIGGLLSTEDEDPRPRRRANRGGQSLEWVPEIRGQVMVTQMSSVPNEVTQRLAVEERDVSGVTRGLFTYAYWRPPQGEDIHVIELNPWGHSCCPSSTGRSLCATSWRTFAPKVCTQH